MHPLIESLISRGPVVTDGSWGTQMQKRGLKRGECPDSWNLTHPERVSEVARQYVDVDGIGANCGQGIEAFLPICARLRQATDLPIWMKPNAGLPEIVDDQVVFRTTADEFVQYIPELVDAGANFIGGCCGTDQGFVEAIRAMADNL